MLTVVLLSDCFRFLDITTLFQANLLRSCIRNLFRLLLSLYHFVVHGALLRITPLLESNLLFWNVSVNQPILYHLCDVVHHSHAKELRYRILLFTFLRTAVHISFE